MIENPFSKSPQQNTSDNLTQPKQEKLSLTVELATERDLEEIKQLMLFAAKSDKDSFFLGTTLRKEQIKINASEFRQRLFSFDRFVVLARSNREAVGVTFARQNEPGVWYVPYAYVKPGSRGDAGLRMLSVGLTKILNENGKKVVFVVKKKNIKMVKFAKRVGSVVKHGVLVDKNKNRLGKLGYLMELDLTSPEVVKKLKRASNVG